MSDDKERVAIFVVLWVIAGLLALFVLVPLGLLLVGTQNGQRFIADMASGWWLFALMAVVVAVAVVIMYRYNKRERDKAMQKFLERQRNQQQP